MAAETIVVDDADGTDRTFTEVVSSRAGVREFRELGAAPSLPYLLRFSKVEPSNPSNGVTRVRVYIGRSIQNSSSGRVNTGSCTFEMVIPHDGGDFTSAVMATLVSNLTDILSGGASFANAIALANGSVPTGDFAA
jgi:hypothetical protein